MFDSSEDAAPPECTDAAASIDELRRRARDNQRELTRVRYRQLQIYAELHERGFEALGLRGLPDLIRADLNCSPRAARELAIEVRRFVGCNAVSGQPIVATYPTVADALSVGSISFEHAKVIGDMIDTLPAEVRAHHGEEVERALSELAVEHDPVALRRLAQRIVAHLDPDGAEPRDDQHHRHRSVRLGTESDGAGFLEGSLTASCAAIWQAVLAPLAAQRSEDDLGPDTRTQWQRWHDAFEEAGRMLLKSGRLPRQAGVPAQLMITIDLADLERRVGVATTHHGGTLSIEQALRLAADARVVPVVFDQKLGRISFGRGRRLASAGQRAALFARDRGCTFPGCARTAAQSEIHHMTEWSKGGSTDLDNLTITCGYHNNEAPRQGWTTSMVDGAPHWRPPKWLDPAQVPKRNWVHHPELLVPTRR
ncbi:MAG TPA: DUF222 domain-containing protein [Jatrophihabitans sp.]|nr:DUF222 domain-containing protein [Jatrophihabitans sp.]